MHHEQAVTERGKLRQLPGGLLYGSPLASVGQVSGGRADGVAAERDNQQRPGGRRSVETDPSHQSLRTQKWLEMIQQGGCSRVGIGITRTHHGHDNRDNSREVHGRACHHDLRG